LSFAVIMFLGACISLSSLVEGGVIDWSALHLNRVLTLPAEDAGRAVLFFSVAMTVARFMGDRLSAVIAPNLLLAIPLVIAGVLLTTAVVTAHVTMLVWAYIFIGLAVANAFPIIISEAGRAAGDQPLREISVIVGFAYFGLISGPALFGVLAHFMGLDATVLGIAGIAFVLGVASLAMPRFVAGAGARSDSLSQP
jgi:fucose permease